MFTVVVVGVAVYSHRPTKVEVKREVINDDDSDDVDNGFYAKPSIFLIHLRGKIEHTKRTKSAILPHSTAYYIHIELHFPFQGTRLFCNLVNVKGR